MTRWEEGKLDAQGKVSARHLATQTAPTFSRDGLGASLRVLDNAIADRPQAPPGIGPLRRLCATAVVAAVSAINGKTARRIGVRLSLASTERLEARCAGQG
jgi:hypothetical protein